MRIGWLKSPHHNRLLNNPKPLFPQRDEGSVNLATHLSINGIGYAGAAWFGKPFDEKGDVYALAHQIFVEHKDVTYTDANFLSDALILRCRGAAHSYGSLHVQDEPHGTECVGEFQHFSIAERLH
jgi:hypothetical protein